MAEDERPLRRGRGTDLAPAACDPGSGSRAMAFLCACCSRAWSGSSVSSTEMANTGAIHNFALNLRPLLLQPPVKDQVTMGLDPGSRPMVTWSFTGGCSSSGRRFKAKLWIAPVFAISVKLARSSRSRLGCNRRV